MSTGREYRGSQFRSPANRSELCPKLPYQQVDRWASDDGWGAGGIRPRHRHRRDSRRMPMYRSSEPWRWSVVGGVVSSSTGDARIRRWLCRRCCRRRSPSLTRSPRPKPPAMPENRRSGTAVKDSHVGRSVSSACVGPREVERGRCPRR